MTTAEYISTEEIESWCTYPKCKYHKIITCRSGKQLDYCKDYKTFCFNAIISCRQKPTVKTARQTTFKV